MQGSVHEVTIHSKSLQEDVLLLVYLPSTYTSLYDHTVVIAQDGQDYIQFGKVLRLLESMQPKIEPTIFVGIPYKDIQDRRNKYHSSGIQNQAYIRFLAHELTPYLDWHYATHQMGKGRILLGDSLGATVSLLASVMYPHTFGKCILQSPYVDERVMQQANALSSSHNLDIYHVIGTEESQVATSDGSIKNFITPNRRLRELLKTKPITYHYHEFQGNHTWKHWQNDLPTAFSSMLTL